MSSVNEIEKLLEARGVMPNQAPSLEPTRQGLQRIGFFDSDFFMRLQENPLGCVIVAGTNGKGSTAATLEALCRSAGERTGLYTSPHLEKITERMRIDGVDVSDDLFAQSYEFVAAQTQELKLSHFEMLTLIAIDIFCLGRITSPVQRLILEVGLGGTWDSTNAIPHGMAIITQLGLDHENLLGGSLIEIATNKFGVIAQGTRVVHAPLAPELLSLAQEVRNQTNSVWREAEPSRCDVEEYGREPLFAIQTRWGSASLQLPGARGATNTALALTAFAELGHDPERHLRALAKVRWPGRMERIRSAPSKAPLYLSGDHNPSGVASLVDLLKHYRRRHLYVLAGVGRDHDLDGTLAHWPKSSDLSLYLTETPFKGIPIAEYGKWLTIARGSWADPKEALAHVMEKARPEDMILVTGSLYLVGAVRKLLTNINPQG